MDELTYEFPAAKTLTRPAHIGVVGSGDLEIILRPSQNPTTSIKVKTSVNGFQDIWERVFEKFTATHDIQADIIVNDFGATPGVVSMRLAQVMEVAEYDQN